MYDVDVDTVCHQCRALETARRHDQAKHEQEKPPLGVPAHGDGRIYTVRPVGRVEDFETEG